MQTPDALLHGAIENLFANWQALSTQYPDAFIVLCGTQVCGPYKTSQEAYRAAFAQFETGTFLVKCCGESTEGNLIQTPQEYDWVASRLEDLTDASPGSAEATELRRLTRLIAEFETRGLPLFSEISSLPDDNIDKGAGIKQPKKILLVDDDAAAAFIARTVVRQLQVEVDLLVASHGREALGIVREMCQREQYPVLILLDIHMPVMDGFEFLEELQNSAGLSSAAHRIVLLSSSKHDRDVAKAKQYPVIVGIIEKPLTLEKLSKFL